MSDKIKIGLIGLGGISQLVHLPILLKMHNVTIAAVSELNKQKLKHVSDKFNLHNRFSNFHLMLEKEEIDAVVIATPTNTHKEIAIDCIKAGKNVFIEKPVARTFKEAKEISDMADKHKKLAMVGMNFRFRPDVMLLKSMLNAKEIGEIINIRTTWLRKKSSEQKWITRKDESGGGVILDLGIVVIDLALWLLDYPELKTATVSKFNNHFKSVEDTALGFVRTSNNSVINFFVSWSLQNIISNFCIEVFGSEGTIFISPFKALRRAGDDYIDFTPSLKYDDKSLFKKSYENEMKYFIGAIKNLNPLFSSIKEAVPRMKLIEAIYKSAESKSEVNL